MNEDLEVLRIYISFIIRFMKRLDDLLEKEKTLLAKISFFNKGRTIESIRYGYERYRNDIKYEWEKIYSNSMNSSETQENWELLSYEGTIYAKTTIQKDVEQFYYKLSTGLDALVSAYDKKKTEKDRNDYRLLFDHMFLVEIEMQMNKIFPYAIAALNSTDGNTDDKKAFIEENNKHNVNIL